MSTGPGAALRTRHLTTPTPSTSRRDRRTAPPRTSAMFSSLRVRNYRLFATGPGRSPTPAPGCSASPRTGWCSASPAPPPPSASPPRCSSCRCCCSGCTAASSPTGSPSGRLLLVTQTAHGPDRSRARRPHPLRPRPGLARLPRRLRRSAWPPSSTTRPASPSSPRWSAPDQLQQRGQPQLRELPVRPAGRPRRRRCADHRRRHAAGPSCSTACPSSPPSPACC